MAGQIRRMWNVSNRSMLIFRVRPLSIPDSPSPGLLVLPYPTAIKLEVTLVGARSC
jgi:hypothetical protein